MNCCDEYGNCRQGRDCPVRKRHAVQYDTGLDQLDLVMQILSYAITLGGMACMAFILIWWWYA